MAEAGRVFQRRIEKQRKDDRVARPGQIETSIRHVPGLVTGIWLVSFRIRSLNLPNAEIFRKVRKTTFSRSPPGQSLCQWRQKGVSRPNSGGVAADFHDAQLENQTSDRLRIGGNLLVTNSSIDCESFISGLSSPLTFSGCFSTGETAQ